MSQFEDYYELLELSPNANLATIERVFRYFATKWHPDAGGDKAKFTKLVRAFETLRDPATRAAYDAKYQQRQQEAENLISNARSAGRDTVDRHKLLCLFYARRRQDAKRPAVSFNGSGGLQVAVWKHKSGEDGPSQYSVRVDRSYKDGEEFKSTQYLRDNDLLRVQQLLTKADEWIENDKGRGYSQQASRGR